MRTYTILITLAGLGVAGITASVGLWAPGLALLVMTGGHAWYQWVQDD